MNQEMIDRRVEAERRFYHYAFYIPERRCGERRFAVPREIEGVCFCPDCGEAVPEWQAECGVCGCVWDD